MFAPQNLLGGFVANLLTFDSIVRRTKKLFLPSGKVIY